jgi:mannose-6-phosphate isomerase-like protein (cupin superfamily)
MPAAAPRYATADFTEIPGVPCPCGSAKRAFADVPAFPGTLHVTTISENARRHYHKSHTETYYVLECGPGATLELDDDRVPLRPGVAVVIPPGVRHRAAGRMKVLIVCLPEFDPADEWFD